MRENETQVNWDGWDFNFFVLFLNFNFNGRGRNLEWVVMGWVAAGPIHKNYWAKSPNQVQTDKTDPIQIRIRTEERENFQVRKEPLTTRISKTTTLIFHLALDHLLVLSSSEASRTPNIKNPRLTQITLKPQRERESHVGPNFSGLGTRRPPQEGSHRRRQEG